VWQLASGWLIDPLFVSSPIAVVVSLYQSFSTGSILPHIGVTFSQIGVGFVIGFVPGVVLGNVMGLSKRFGRLASPYLTFFFTIPLIAIAPLFVIWLGIGFAMKAGLVAFIVFFLVARTTFTGMSTINHELVDSVRLMGAGHWERIRLAILPQEAVWILTAAKLALPLAVAGDVVGEFISSNQGLGFVMNNAASVLDTTRLLMAVVILAVFVTAIVGLLSVVERRLLGWQKQ
jgi:NitT/TauT family transport system permease protein